MGKQIDPANLTGPQKAAIFFLAMGEEFTQSFFKELDEVKIKKIGKQMSEINYISSDALNVVMEEFFSSMDSNDEASLSISGREFLQEVVTKTLDKDTAREVFRVIGDDIKKTPFSDLEYISAENLVSMLKGEHPQTIALILSYIPQGKAAEILTLLPDDIKGDIALRLVKIGEVQDDIVREIDETLKKDLTVGGVSARKFDGIEALASILNEVDGKTEEYVLAQIEKDDADLAEDIKQKMFVFEDLLQIDSRGFREILQNVDNQGLAKALKTASEEMKEMIFGNLSERASEMLKEDIEVMGPVKLSEVEEAQQSIIKAAKKLEEEGKIVLAGKGAEDVLV